MILDAVGWYLVGIAFAALGLCCLAPFLGPDEPKNPRER